MGAVTAAATALVVGSLGATSAVAATGRPAVVAGGSGVAASSLLGRGSPVAGLRRDGPVAEAGATGAAAAALRLATPGAAGAAAAAMS